MGKVIFLDIDGVLNSNFWNGDDQKEISGGTLIDSEKFHSISMKKPPGKRYGNTCCQAGFIFAKDRSKLW